MGISAGSSGGRLVRQRLGVTAAIMIAVVAASVCGVLSPVACAQKRTGGSFVIGSSIRVEPDETVEGSVVSLGGMVSVDGHVTGDAVSIGGPVTVSGTVDGDVVSVGSRVSLGEIARVGGDVTTVGGAIQRAEGAFVGGNVTSAGFPSFRFDTREFRWSRMPWPYLRMPWPFLGAMWAARLVGAIVLSLVVVAIWPGATTSVAAAIETRLGRSLLVGLLALLLFVPGIVLLAVTLIGIPLIPVWVIFYLVAGAFGYSAVALLVGDRVVRLTVDRASLLAKVVVGALVLALLGLVPALGAIVGIAVAIVGLGAVLDTRFGTNRPWFRQREPSPPGPPQQ